jgi:hypothetical protein
MKTAVYEDLIPPLSVVAVQCRTPIIEVILTPVQSVDVSPQRPALSAQQPQRESTLSSAFSRRPSPWHVQVFVLNETE